MTFKSKDERFDDAREAFLRVIGELLPEKDYVERRYRIESLLTERGYRIGGI